MSSSASEFETGLSPLVKLVLSIVFFIIIGAYLELGFGDSSSFTLTFAALVGAYMAMNIGANDVANNVGPAVGSKAIPLLGAIIIAAIFEAGGAIIAGGEVVTTIKKGIINPATLDGADIFISLMLAALMAGALWLNLATYLGAPVSTTHSIVGGVLGAGIAAGGFAIVNWPTLGAIAASWVISPVLGGAIAATFLFAIKRLILHSDDMLIAAKRFVPWLLAIMAWAFATYLALKGLKKIWKLDFQTASLIGLSVAAVVYWVTGRLIARKVESMAHNAESVNNLFTLPLIFSAALLSFAHGANDVANAIGPLAAIADSLLNEGVSAKAAIPLWVMLIGALGIALGLLLFGPKLIRTVGTEITELDKSRAFCIAMSAAITVIIASQLGLPVSSTHIAVGGIFGVGFLREYLKTRYATQIHQIIDHHEGEEREKLEHLLNNFESVPEDEMKAILKTVKQQKSELGLTKVERKRLKAIYSEKLVQRSALRKIVAAWLITVPASAALAAGLFVCIRVFS